MLYKKPQNLRYTELCMYVDENVPKIANPGEHADIEATVYNYLWLLVKALAIKKCMFNKFEDYDGYAFYAATRLFLALRKNYLNQGKVIKGKKIKPPIVFQGGVSKNIGVVKAFEKITGFKIYVDNNSHLTGALGVAILSRAEEEIDFSFDIEDIIFETKGTECKGCSNNCEIIKVMRDNKIIDSWGNRCPRGELVHK